MLSQFVDTLRKANRLVAGGMFFFESPGHMLAETDYLLRLVRHYPLIRSRQPVVILPPTPFSTVIGELLKHCGFEVVMDPNAISILREIQLFHPDLVIDVGHAHCKLVVPDQINRTPGDLYPLNLCWALRAEEYLAQTIRYHEAWNHTRGQLPLRDALQKSPPDSAFRALLGKQKYAVVQIKNIVGNATARVLPSELYRPAFELLRDTGHALILAGREPMPDDFKRYDVFDYPRSSFVSPRNDFHLFASAAVGLTSPSGAGLFCDTLGIPYCQIASWTLLPHPSEKTVMVPSRLKERSTGKILTFTQQAIAFQQTYHPIKGPGHFNTTTYEDIPPSPEDIRAGLQEAIQGVGSAFPHQVATLHKLDPIGMWRAAASRLSPAFLNAHPEFLK
jgi:putative glycosyltransferase (TIGR04372 family)